MTNNHTCDYCDKEFTFDMVDTYISSEIVEGQYVEYTAVKCPHCGDENRW